MTIHLTPVNDIDVKQQSDTLTNVLRGIITRIIKCTEFAGFAFPIASNWQFYRSLRAVISLSLNSRRCVVSSSYIIPGIIPGSNMTLLYGVAHLVGCLFILYLCIRIFLKATCGKCVSPVCLVGKTALITGGSQGKKCVLIFYLCFNTK